MSVMGNGNLGNWVASVMTIKSKKFMSVMGNEFLMYVMPWFQWYLDLPESTVVERKHLIGKGTVLARVVSKQTIRKGGCCKVLYEGGRQSPTKSTKPRITPPQSQGLNKHFPTI
eukprot:2175125-Amphidinium_carterae.1